MSMKSQDRRSSSTQETLFVVADVLNRDKTVVTQEEGCCTQQAGGFAGVSRVEEARYVGDKLAQEQLAAGRSHQSCVPRVIGRHCQGGC